MPGIAIGTKCGLTCVGICMDEFENEFLILRSEKPLVWLRYIDHVFFRWAHGEKELHKFMEDLNNHQANIYSFSKNSVPFLDLNFQLSGGELTINLQTKPTDRQQYLHFALSYPNHTKCSIAFSQALRVSSICSRECNFNKHISEMKTRFQRRNYPNNFAESEVKKYQVLTCV